MDGDVLATVSDLQDRLSFEMTDDDKREALGALEDLSDDARLYGSNSWLTPDSTPGGVCRLVLRAAARHMRNPDGFIQSRAGDETLMWSDKGELGAASFTAKEQEALRQYAGSPASVYTTEVVAWGNRRPVEVVDIFVPTTSGYVFPWATPCEEGLAETTGTTEAAVRDYRRREIGDA